MSVIVHVPKTVPCSRTTGYRSSLTGFLTSLPLRVVYKGWSLASATSDEGDTSPAGISSAAKGFGWYSCGERSICGLAACVLSGSGSVSCAMFPWRFWYPIWDFVESFLRATRLRLILWPPTSTTYDLGKTCFCTTVAALHSYNPGSGFTLTWSPDLSGGSSLVPWRSW